MNSILSHVRTSVLFAAVLLLLPAASLLAQFRHDAMEPPYESDVLSARPVHYILGLALGGYAFDHLGTFSPSCNCEFKDASGVRPLAGLEFMLRYPKIGIAVKTLVTYRDYSAEFTRRSSRIAHVVGEGDKLLDFENRSDVRLRSIGIAPAMAWTFPASTVYWFVGVEVGIPLESRYNHIEEVLNTDYEYFSGSPETTLMEERDIPGGKRVGLGVTGGFGGDIFLSDRIFLTPTAGITYPLSSVSSIDSDWKILSGYAAIMLRMRLN